jgi:acyl-CoA hydrolase
MARMVSMDEVVAAIRPVDTLAVGLGPAVPGGILHALGEREDWERLELFGALLPDLYQLNMRPGVEYRSGFFGPAERFLRDSGARIEFVPADFRRFEPIVARLRPRVMATVASLPDENRNVSLSLHAGATVDELHRAGADPDRLLIVEVSEHYPRTYGLPPEHTHSLSLDEIDLVVETDRQPFELADAVATEVEEAIAQHASRFIHDGSTIQTGIGGIPSTIARLLADSPVGDLGVHSEMLTTGLMHLHKAGKVSNARKGPEFQGISVCTFAAGTTELYEWLHENPEVAFLPVSIVNSPEVIARNNDMVTINGAMSVDLSGQIVADTIVGRQFSGIGGHEDFVAGGDLQSDDRSLICLPATSVVNGELISRITGRLPEGSVVTTPRHLVDVVVTEYGAAELQGRTIRERALALAEIAHPQFRDELAEMAADWPAD